MLIVIPVPPTMPGYTALHVTPSALSRSESSRTRSMLANWDCRKAWVLLKAFSMLRSACQFKICRSFINRLKKNDSKNIGLLLKCELEQKHRMAEPRIIFKGYSYQIYVALSVVQVNEKHDTTGGWLLEEVQEQIGQQEMTLVVGSLKNNETWSYC